MCSREGQTRPRKSLGQNWLTERHIIDEIVAAVSRFDSDAVLEIGPGTGALTEPLAELGKPLVCVEADEELAGRLADRYAGRPGVAIVTGDFLQWDMSALPGARTVCAGNLPYYITTPIIQKLIGARAMLSGCVLMVQKEVADRLLAPPGTRECSSFSLYCRYYAAVSRVRNVSRGCFFPAPKVDSSVIELHFRSEPPVEAADETLLFRIIRAAYSKRRKTLLNNLANSELLWWSREKAARVLAESGIDGSRRGESLTLEEYALLCNTACETEGS